MTNLLALRLAVALGATGALVLAPASAALAQPMARPLAQPMAQPMARPWAHPLGNFTVNHYNGLTLSADKVDVLAIVDVAEIPTQQELPSIDTDGDDTLSELELASHATEQCAALVTQQTLSVDGQPVELQVDQSGLTTVAGAAGLPTLRLTCDLTAAVDLVAPATVAYADGFRADNVGWHEITARADGVRLTASTVPSASVSDELRAYPQDLLSSPLDDRAVTLRTAPGAGVSVSGVSTVGSSQDPFSRLVAWGDRTLTDLIGGELTVWVGGLAAVLALLLGAGHALLPGHGKTVMAAYLAGRRGSRRDAYKVGAIVTLTHTASVLVLGLILSLSAAVLGEQALRYLGVVSGVIIALVGAFLLRDAIRARRARRGGDVPVAALASASAHAHARTVTSGGHVHSHDDGRPHDDGHTHDGHAHEDAHSHDAYDGHSHSQHSHDEHGDHGHDEHSHGEHGPDEHGHEEAHSHVHSRPAVAAGAHAVAADSRGGVSGWLSHSHDHDSEGGHSHSHSHGPGSGVGGHTGLIGMGVAGGLVPSPSALIVLIGSIGLGRTVFGVLLVLLYGVGMAGTLTAVGLLLVRVRGRLDSVDVSGRLGGGAAKVVAALPMITATLVLVVGIGLAVRGLLAPV